MKTTCGIAVSLVALGALGLAAIVSAQDTTKDQASAASALEASKRADAYYNFMIGHTEEMEYESSGRGELATQAIEAYKKALESDPNSTVMMERLAEIYAKSQHIRDAVLEAKAVLKLDPDDVAAHRLLARIYVRTLGDMEAGAVQQENLTKAIEQFQAVLKSDPGDLSSALWLARLYRFENQHAEAEKVLRGALRHDPESSPALEQLSQLLMDGGRSQEAITLLSQAAGDSASPEVLDLLGDAYSQSKDYARAEAAYRKAVDSDPDDPAHRHGLAQALLAEDKYAEALEQFKRLAEMEPGTSENYLRMAQLYRRLGQYDQAESSLVRAKQLAPGSLEVLYNEALLYEDEGRFEDAVKILNEAINGLRGQSSSEGNPNALSILYEQLGRAYRDQQNYTAAIRTFEEMSKLGAESKKRAQMLLIDTYRESHDLDRAIAETQKALQLNANGTDPDMTVTLATLYGEKGDTDQAMKLLKDLLHGNDSDEEIYLDIAQVQERGRRYADAEASAQKAEQMAREAGDKQGVWFMLGAIYEHEKKFGPAEDEFRKVLQVNPSNAAVLNYYGYMLADRGVRLEEATGLILRAISADPNNGAYLDSLGWVYFKQNKLSEAEEYLRKASDRSRHDPTILGHLAEVYVKLGQTDRAADLMERALTEWQRSLPGDYEAEKVTDLEAQLKTLKHRLAQKSSPDTAKPQ
jgi:tetratricopeptide (TPR) repeat protein